MKKRKKIGKRRWWKRERGKKRWRMGRNTVRHLDKHTDRKEKKIFSRNYGREPTFHILYSSRYFNTKKNEEKPKKQQNWKPTKNKITGKTENHNIKKKQKTKKLKHPERCEIEYY